MQNQLSYVINKADIYVEGIGFIGVGTYSAPELKFKRVEGNGAAGTYKRSYGAVEELEASVKLTVTNQMLYKAAAKANNAKIICTSALETGADVKGRRDVLVGGIDIKENEVKNGEVLEVELSIFPTYWLKEISGVVMVEIDKLKDIVKVDGKDLLEETRSVVGG